MTLVVFGIDALDPDLVSPDDHPNLTLAAHETIDTIDSSAGDPSTHELWPTIITGLPPTQHGLTLDDGVAWEHPLLRIGSDVGNYLLPDRFRTWVGAWLLNNTDQDAFRVEASYYENEGIETVFDDRAATTIGVPNYVTDPDEEDREHQLRRDMGQLFERDSEARGGHRSSDPVAFYELCLEMSMVRVARTRRALRSRQNELVFGYTSGLDLIGHVSYDRPAMQAAAYEELDHFIGELVEDLRSDDELLLVSDHGLQDGVHTHEAMVAATDDAILEPIDGVETVRDGIESVLETNTHRPAGRTFDRSGASDDEARVQEHLEDLGYM